MGAETVETVATELLLVGDDETWEVELTPGPGGEPDTVAGLSAEMRALGWELHSMRVEPQGERLVCRFVPVR